MSNRWTLIPSEPEERAMSMLLLLLLLLLESSFVGAVYVYRVVLGGSFDPGEIGALFHMKAAAGHTAT